MTTWRFLAKTETSGKESNGYARNVKHQYQRGRMPLMGSSVDVTPSRK